MRLHGKSGHMEPVPLPGAPFSHYYSQEASDEGIIMETDVAVKEVSTTRIMLQLSDFPTHILLVLYSRMCVRAV
jgi:hypothetical protein